MNTYAPQADLLGVIVTNDVCLQHVFVIVSLFHIQDRPCHTQQFHTSLQETVIGCVQTSYVRYKLVSGNKTEAVNKFSRLHTYLVQRLIHNPLHFSNFNNIVTFRNFYRNYQPDISTCF